MPRRKSEPAASAEKRPRGRPPLVRDFYGSAVSRAERAVLASARQLEGLDEEIAVLRARLRSAVDDTPESFRLMVRGMELLAKLVAARYRLSKKAENDLAAHIAGLLRGFAEQFFLVAADDA